MAEFTFEGEIESLRPNQKELVREVLQKRELKGNKVLIETLGKPGDNYIANVQRITVELHNGETFKMVAKIGPTNEILRGAMGTTLLFSNECVMYNEVLPKFMDLQQAAGLSQEELFRFPKCYGTLMEPLNEIILLEDLKESNFEMLDRFTPLTNECVKQILNNFAKLHSLSFVLKNQETDTFESFIGKFKDYYGQMNANPDFQYYFESLEADAISVMDKEKYKMAVTGSLSKLSEISANVTKYERNSKYSVVTHRDGWTNNVMFLLKNNEPVEAVLIDYQLSMVGNPVHDLLYMIFSCTDYSTRHKHYYEWIDFYHSELDKSLTNFGLKANHVYPRDQLDVDLRSYSKIYFASAIFVFTALIRKPEDAAKMKEAMEGSTGNEEEMNEILNTVQISNLDSESIALFRRKVEDLVESYYEFGYFDVK